MNQPDITPTQDTTSRPAARPKLYGRVDRLANYLRKLADRSPGDVAALRRMKPDGVLYRPA